MSRGPGTPSFDLTRVVLLSSRMMSMQSSTHSSQMNTVGPAMSFLTSCWLLPQKLQYRVLRESPPDLAAGISLTHLRLGGSQEACEPATKTMLNVPPGSRQPQNMVYSCAHREQLLAAAPYEAAAWMVGVGRFSN